MLLQKGCIAICSLSTASSFLQVFSGSTALPQTPSPLDPDDGPATANLPQQPLAETSDQVQKSPSEPIVARPIASQQQTEADNEAEQRRFPVLQADAGAGKLREDEMGSQVFSGSLEIEIDLEEAFQEAAAQEAKRNSDFLEDRTALKASESSLRRSVLQEIRQQGSSQAIPEAQLPQPIAETLEKQSPLRVLGRENKELDVDVFDTGLWSP